MNKFFSIKHGLKGLKKQLTFSSGTLSWLVLIAMLLLVFQDVDTWGKLILVAIAYYFFSVVRRREGYQNNYQEGYNAGLRDGNPERYSFDSESADDPLLPEAIHSARMAHKISASMLRKQLHIGHAKAARLMDIMAELDIIERGEGGEWKVNGLLNKLDADIQAARQDKMNTPQ